MHARSATFDAMLLSELQRKGAGQFLAKSWAGQRHAEIERTRLAAEAAMARQTIARAMAPRKLNGR
jgi:hypothetical protein